MIIVTYLVNRSFELGIFPDKLKISVVKPVHTGRQKKLNNYRSITLIPIIAKVFEKSYYNIFSAYLNKYKLIYKNQSEFKKNKSTTLKTFNLIKNNITQNINRSRATVALFFDMTKGLRLYQP